MAKPTIVIVEDELIIANDLKNILVKLGFHVPAIARSGERAIAAFNEFDPHLVLLDIVIKGEMDGIALAKLLKCEYRIPFLFITSHGDPLTIARAMETRPYGYLIKPFENADVDAAVSLALSTYSKELQLLRDKSLHENVIQDVAVQHDHFFIRDKGILLKLLFADIVSLEADGNYTLIHTCDAKKFALRRSLKDTETKLPESIFLRIHKSHIVNLKTITAFDLHSVYLGKNQIPVGRVYYSDLTKRLNLLSAE